jgi:hypothetical protein
MFMLEVPHFSTAALLSATRRVFRPPFTNPACGLIWVFFLGDECIELMHSMVKLGLPTSRRGLEQTALSRDHTKECRQLMGGGLHRAHGMALTGPLHHRWRAPEL